MKNTLRRSFIFILVFTLCCVSLFVNTNIVSADAHDYPDGYIRFVNPNTRINSNGHFEFSVRFALTSDKFVANDNYIRIDTWAEIYRSSERDYIRDPNIQFEVTLYRDGWLFDKKIGSYYGYADRIYGGRTFTGIDKGDTYYFVISPTDPNFTMTSYYLEGYGDVGPVTVK